MACTALEACGNLLPAKKGAQVLVDQITFSHPSAADNGPAGVHEPQGAGREGRRDVRRRLSRCRQRCYGLWALTGQESGRFGGLHRAIWDTRCRC